MNYRRTQHNSRAALVVRIERYDRFRVYISPIGYIKLGLHLPDKTGSEGRCELVPVVPEVIALHVLLDNVAKFGKISADFVFDIRRHLREGCQLLVHLLQPAENLVLNKRKAVVNISAAIGGSEDDTDLLENAWPSLAESKRRSWSTPVRSLNLSNSTGQLGWLSPGYSSRSSS